MSIENMNEQKKELSATPERKIITCSSYEQYVNVLSQHMILPKDKVDGLKKKVSPIELAALVEKPDKDEIRIEYIRYTPERFAISSDIEVPTNKKEIMHASRTKQLAYLAETEARLRVVQNSEHTPDKVRFAGFRLGREIDNIHRLGGKALKGQRVFGDKTRVAKAAAALAVVATACKGTELNEIINAFPSPTAPQTVETTEAPTFTPEPSPTSKPTEVPTPTERPAPELPREIIDSSWGILDENSLQKDGDGWVLASKREGWADWILFRWDPQSGEWIDERPDFWECGRWPMLKDSLPTYIIDEESDYFIASSGFKFAFARGCLVEINSYPDPFYPGEAIRGKFLFYDNNKKAHVYDFVSVGGTAIDKTPKSATAICQDTGTGSGCRTYYFDEVLTLFQNYLEKGKTGTRQIDFNFQTFEDERFAESIPFHATLESYNEYYQQFYQAILTGENFPEPPEGFFLYAYQFNITPQKLVDN